MNTKENKHIVLTDKIPKEHYSHNESMDLDSCYQQTVAELGLQQSKRDQIIAFYLTILGFVIPNVISLNIGDFSKAIAFLVMYMVGIIFCHVILRYRIYKEVYWIACRVLAQMCNIKVKYRTKKNIYLIFYNALVQNESSIVQYQKQNAKKKSLLRSFTRQINSAETLLYETMALFSSFVGGIGVFYIFNQSKLVGIALALYLVYMFLRINYKYTTRLMALYDCVAEEDNDKKLLALESTFSKAWMLHCYLDDVIEDEEEKEGL